MKVYITRHGEVPSNVLKIFNLKGEDLTEKGIEQAKTLRMKLENLDYDIIFTSPYLRAVHTAKLANVKNREIIVDERLKERDAGNLIGQSLDAVDRKEYWNYYSTEDMDAAEDVKTFFKRVFSFIDELKENDYESVLIVGHSGISKAFSAYFEGIEDGKFLDRGISNCEIKEYEL